MAAYGQLRKEEKNILPQKTTLVAKKKPPSVRQMVSKSLLVATTLTLSTLSLFQRIPHINGTFCLLDNKLLFLAVK